MKVLILWAYYPAYLSYFYERHPWVASLGYREHLQVMLDDHFGWPGELSRYMNRQGIDTEFVVANDMSLQMKWARENGFGTYSEVSAEKRIAMAQVSKLKPDTLWIGPMFDYYGSFVHESLEYCRQAIAWISSPIPETLDVSGLSTLVTSKPGLLGDKERMFSKVIIARPGFDGETLKALGPIQKTGKVVFAGSITPYHTKRAEFLAHLIDNGVSVEVYGQSYAVPPLATQRRIALAAKKVIRDRDLRSAMAVMYRSKKEATSYNRHLQTIGSNRDPVFGLDMYRTLAAAKLVLNVHIDVAGDMAGNMRMFEATGVGSCLVTEHSANIDNLFIPGKEVMTYNGKEDLLQTVQKALRAPDLCDRVAKAGQQRALTEHSVERLYNEIEPAFAGSLA